MRGGGCDRECRGEIYRRKVKSGRRKGGGGGSSSVGTFTHIIQMPRAQGDRLASMSGVEGGGAWGCCPGPT